MRWRWRIVLDSTVRITTPNAVSLLLIGYAANNLLPMRAGDVVRAQLLHQQHGTSRLAGLGTVVVEKIFDGIILALFLALVALWLLRQIPLVGGLIAFVALLAGIGAFVWQAWNRREPAPRTAALGG